MPGFILFRKGRTWLRKDGRDKYLAGQQSMVLLALMGRHISTMAFLSECLWPHPDYMPDYWCGHVRVVVHKLRDRLRGTGWIIKRRYTFGYSLERERTPDI